MQDEASVAVIGGPGLPNPFGDHQLCMQPCRRDQHERADKALHILDDRALKSPCHFVDLADVVSLATAGTEDSQALVDSTADLAALLPLASAIEDTAGHQLPNAETQAPDLLAAEVLAAEQPQSQVQPEPLDPFASSASALPEMILQQSTTLPKALATLQLHPALISADTSTITSNLLDNDMAGVDSLLFLNQSNAGTPVASLLATSTAETDSSSHMAEVTSSTDLPNSQANLPQNSTASEGLDALSADEDDDFAENIDFAAADKPPIHTLANTLATQRPGAASDKEQEALHQQQVQPQLGSEQLDLPFSQAATDMSTPSETITADAQAVPPDFKPKPADVPQDEPPNTQAPDIVSDVELAGAGPTTLGVAKEQQGQLEGTADDVKAEIAEPDATVKPHEVAMARAEEAERRLLTGASHMLHHQLSPKSGSDKTAINFYLEHDRVTLVL